MEITEKVLNGNTMLQIAITTTMKQCTKMVIGQVMKMGMKKAGMIMKMSKVINKTVSR